MEEEDRGGYNGVGNDPVATYCKFIHIDKYALRFRTAANSHGLEGAGACDYDVET